VKRVQLRAYALDRCDIDATVSIALSIVKYTMNLEQALTQLDQVHARIGELRASIPQVLHSLTTEAVAANGLGGPRQRAAAGQDERAAAFRAAATRADSLTKQLVGEIEQMQDVFAYGNESRRKNPNGITRTL